MASPCAAPERRIVVVLRPEQVLEDLHRAPRVGEVGVERGPLPVPGGDVEDPLRAGDLVQALLHLGVQLAQLALRGVQHVAGEVGLVPLAAAHRDGAVPVHAQGPGAAEVHRRVQTLHPEERALGRERLGVVAHRRAHLRAGRVEEREGDGLGEAADQAPGRVARPSRAEVAPVGGHVGRVGDPAQGQGGGEHRHQRQRRCPPRPAPAPPPPRGPGPSRRRPARRAASGTHRRGGEERGGDLQHRGQPGSGPANVGPAGGGHDVGLGEPGDEGQEREGGEHGEHALHPGTGRRGRERRAVPAQHRHHRDGEHARDVEDGPERARAHHPLAEEDRDQPEHRGRGEEGAPCVHRHRRASSTRVVAKSATQVTSR